MLARSWSAQSATPVCSACLEAPALCQSPQRHQAVFMGTGSRRARASSHSPADDMKLWQHHADCAPEARCHQRSWIADVELAWPLRETQRKRHPDSCSDDWSQEEQQRGRRYRRLRSSPRPNSTVSGQCMYSTDYLVICGLVSARPT
jgi:hypothetical protein